MQNQQWHQTNSNNNAKNIKCYILFGKVRFDDDDDDDDGNGNGNGTDVDRDEE